MTPARSLYRHRGFSLIEIVIVLFLAGVMLFCVAGLTDQTFKTLKFLQQKSTTLESATLACERLATELRETVTVPTTGTDIIFRKVLPSAPFWVGNVPGTDPAGWDRTYPNAQTAQIRYRMIGDKVSRQVNSEQTFDIASDVNAFQVNPVSGSPGNYTVVLSILESRRVVTFETIVSCPGVPR